MPPSSAFSLACMTQQPIDRFLFPAQVKIASNVIFRGAFPTCAVSVSASVSWGQPPQSISPQSLEDSLKRVGAHTFQKWSVQLTE